MTYHALLKLEAAISAGDISTIRVLWPQARKMMQFEVNHQPLINRPLNQE